MGREKFADLIDEFKHIRGDSGYSALIVYGTRGYGKSHLLAALVCYFAARKENVVYIPDCREFLEDPVPYMRAAMLFAWTDDEKQQNIMALKTEEDIYQFFRNQDDVIFVIDQLDALDKRKTDDEDTAKRKTYLRRWLTRFRASHKAILSSSANNQSMLNAPPDQSSEKMMYVLGGLTKVSLRSLEQ
jgi:chromosomal replication initiation ATPase DnaA